MDYRQQQAQMQNDRTTSELVASANTPSEILFKLEIANGKLGEQIVTLLRQSSRRLRGIVYVGPGQNLFRL